MEQPTNSNNINEKRKPKTKIWHEGTKSGWPQSIENVFMANFFELVAEENGTNICMRLYENIQQLLVEQIIDVGFSHV